MLNEFLKSMFEKYYWVNGIFELVKWKKGSIVFFVACFVLLVASLELHVEVA
ncbi:hypothetical protein ACUNWD_20025 [Sunxiuqinia sp. A32]|uniref:hypothetical protein n=1 Tax=Sunxiuqinia sp. A32 TaxID=3461496 RepID=UPI0040462256